MIPEDRHTENRPHLWSVCRAVKTNAILDSHPKLLKTTILDSSDILNNYLTLYYATREKVNELNVPSINDQVKFPLRRPS